MVIRTAVALVALLASAPLAAQARAEIAVEEWREVLSGVPTDDDDSVLKVATRYSNESTALINTGNIPEAIHKSMISLVLTRQIHDRKEREGSSVGRQDSDSINGLQTALVGAGLSQTTIRQSAVNLGKILGEKPASMVIKVRQGPRPATAAERAAMIAVIKKDLIDPTSPLFGRADVIGNQACFTVNSKNRFGGYTGNQEAVLYLNPKTKAWTGGGMINYPHGVCLDTAD